MPQTLTRDWIADLGEDYETIHKKYLHTLANLTLTGYNSRYSNRRFEQKQTIEDGFNDSPLVINAELKKVDRWTEKELLARQKWWQDKVKHLWPEPTTNFKPVEVDTKVWIFDGDDLKGTQPRIVHVQGDTIIVTSWYQVLDQLVDRIFEDSRNKYSDIVAPNELLSKYIRDDPTSMRAPERAADTQYYIEMNSDTNTKCRIMVELMKALGWSRDDLSVELTEKIETDEETEQR